MEQGSLSFGLHPGRKTLSAFLADVCLSWQPWCRNKGIGPPPSVFPTGDAVSGRGRKKGGELRSPSALRDYQPDGVMNSIWAKLLVPVLFFLSLCLCVCVRVGSGSKLQRPHILSFSLKKIWRCWRATYIIVRTLRARSWRELWELFIRRLTQRWNGGRRRYRRQKYLLFFPQWCIALLASILFQIRPYSSFPQTIIWYPRGSRERERNRSHRNGERALSQR